MECYSPSLPVEIWDMIVNETNQATRKQLRLSNKYFYRISSPHCFKTVRFELAEDGFNNLLDIALHEELRKHVKKLVLRRSRGLRAFGDFEEWEDSISRNWDSDSDSDSDFDSASDTDGEDGNDDDIMSQQHWSALSINEKHALYDEYEVDRLKARAQVRNLTNHLYFRTLGCRQETDLVHPARTAVVATLDSALKQFDDAVARLTNLTTFVHDPAFFYSRWGTRWRRLRISPDGIILYTDYDEDEDVDALQLSYVLRSLGWANYFNRNLRSLSLYVGGPAFWGAERLRRLWDGHEDETMRSLRYLNRSAAEAEEDAYFGDNGGTRLLRERHLRQLFIMEHAFVYLTHLDCAVSEDDEDGSLVTTAGPLFEFLRRGESLERVRLAFGRLVDSFLQPGVNQPGDGPGELLAQLTRHVPWPRIRELELELVTDERILVGFLSTLAPTLRRLALSRVTLVPSGGTWEFTLRQIVGALQLDSLELLVLCDSTMGERVILDPEAQVWRSWDAKSVCYGHYKSAVVNYFLSGTGKQPLLEPAAFLRDHIPKCERGKANFLQAQSAHLASKNKRIMDVK
ncbi:hypothetical protein K432DRAFT_287955 [Lepidopterella palustris CBS 459.81]|uniref:Uncharacterized protein n=1 Tax=Lepidopterella palustris CBS 459.81 TaxID=1314670 RepID=A0A8E2EIY6_9PEZI|nr:hypothetical protein K432DRAFT_287955 [Lepidopterella palustris CBS 459.81]